MSNVEQYPSPDMDDVQLLDILRAISDPVRLHIVQVLADGEPHSKSKPEWGLDLQKSTMAHHFRALREAGVTRLKIDGRNHTIQLRRVELDAKFPGLIDALLTAPKTLP